MSAEWKTKPISPTCEVMACDKPTTAAYQAMGGGWMALCARHAIKHFKHGCAIRTDELIANGETFS